MVRMTARQKRFCDEYLVDLNATQAAIRAGYSANYAHTNANKLLQITAIKDFLAARMAEKDSELIADQDEVLRYLTSVLRGKSRSSVVVVENIGDFISEAREVKKEPDEKERLKAAELLGKRYGLYTERMESNVDMELNISVDYGEDK